MDPFLKMLIAPRVTVLGKRLEPFSAYHFAALLMFESPFVMGGEINPKDTILATALCSKQWPDSLQSIMDGDDAEVMEWGKSQADADWRQAALQLQGHISWYVEELAEVWYEEGKGKPSAIPLPVQTVTTVLQAMPSVTRAEAWNMPFDELRGLYCAIAEYNGYELMTPRQRALAELAAQPETVHG